MEAIQKLFNYFKKQARIENSAKERKDKASKTYIHKH